MGSVLRRTYALYTPHSTLYTPRKQSSGGFHSGCMRPTVSRKIWFFIASAISLALCAWWTLEAVVAPAMLREALLRGLSEKLGGSASAASVFRTGGDSAVAGGFRISSPGVSFESPILAISSAPGLEPPYAIVCTNCVLEADFSDFTHTAGSGPGLAGSSIEIRNGSVLLMNHPSLPVPAIRLANVNGRLESAGAGNAWTASGTFGPDSKGGFEVRGSGAALEVAEISFQEFADVRAILGIASPSCPSLGISPPVSGQARIAATLTPGRPAAVMCSFRDLRSPFAKGASASGYFSVAIEKGGPGGFSAGGNFFLDRFSYDCLEFARVTGVIDSKEGGIMLKNVSGMLLGGRVQGSVRAWPADGKADVNLDLRDADASDLPHLLLGSGLPLSGRLSVTLSAGIRGITEPGRSEVRGSGSFSWKDAALGYLPLVGGLDAYVAFQRHLAFDTVAADFNLLEEGILLKSGKAEGPLFMLELSKPGAVRFDGKVDIEMVLKRGRTEERRFPVFTKLSETMKKMVLEPFEGVLAVGVRVSGNYLNPQFEIILPGRGR